RSPPRRRSPRARSARRRPASRRLLAPLATLLLRRRLVALLLVERGALRAQAAKRDRGPEEHRGQRHVDDDEVAHLAARLLRDADACGDRWTIGYVQDDRTRREPRHRALDQERAAAERARLPVRLVGEEE